jgi:hypothetical protein
MNRVNNLLLSDSQCYNSLTKLHKIMSNERILEKKESNFSFKNKSEMKNKDKEDFSEILK